MIEDITAELNDMRTLVEAALSYGDLETSQAVLRTIEQKSDILIKILDKLTVSM